MHNRKINIKLMNIGYVSVRMIFDFMKYTDTYNAMKDCKSYLYEERFDDDFGVICNTLFGIKMTYVNDPFNTLKMVIMKFNTNYFAVRGCFECLEYLVEKQYFCDEYTCNAAGTGGNIECLKYLHKKGYRLTEGVCVCAARGGNIECLEYAHKNGCQLSPMVFYEAARVYTSRIFLYIILHISQFSILFI